QGLAQVLVQELDRRHQLNLALTVALSVGRALPRLSLPLLLFCHGISPPRKTSREEGHGSHLSDLHDAKMAAKNLVFYKSLSEYDLNYLSGDDPWGSLSTGWAQTSGETLDGRLPLVDGR